LYAVFPLNYGQVINNSEMFKEKGISHKGTKKPKNTLLKSNFTNNIFSVCLLWTTHIFEMARPTMNEHDISYI
jgi:hypothetical protein